MDGAFWPEIDWGTKPSAFHADPPAEASIPPLLLPCSDGTALVQSKGTGCNLVGFQPSDRALRPWGPSQGKEVDELLVGLSALTLNGCPFEKRKRTMGSRSLGGSIRVCLLQPVLDLNFSPRVPVNQCQSLGFGSLGSFGSFGSLAFAGPSPASARGWCPGATSAAPLAPEVGSPQQHPEALVYPLASVGSSDQAAGLAGFVAAESEPTFIHQPTWNSHTVAAG